jgi:hypothetical protein
MILISNGGSNMHRAAKPSDTIVVGTVDGIAVLGGPSSTRRWPAATSAP